MGKKAEQKKEYILEKAREVFIKKGYANVTMKDIISACDISRGGLYLYFSSTKEIFLTLFRREARERTEAVEMAMWEEMTAWRILNDTISQYKEELLGFKPTMAYAVYEFFLENEDERVVRQWQFDGMAEAIREILDYGIENEEFNPVDTNQWGRHIAMFLEGLALTMPVMQFPPERIDEQIYLLLQPLMRKPKALKAPYIMEQTV